MEEDTVVRSYVDEVKLFTASELLQEVATDKDLKKVPSEVPYESDAMLYDISIKGRGPVEDKVYAKRHFMVQNIRRGNTVL